jgi:Fe2+ transport system protein B
MMAAKTRLPAKPKTGSTKSGNGLVVRAIKNDQQVSEQVEYLLQEFGEFYFGAERIEELDGEDRRGWIKFSTTVGKAHHNLSKLAEVMEKAVESEVAADLELIQAEIEALERRQDGDSERAQRNQERREVRENAAEARKEAVFLEDIADRKQERELEFASHNQEMAERETRRRIYRVRESVLLGITVFCVLLAAFLIVFGVTHDKLIFIGGSGVSAIIAIGGIAKLIFDWGDSSSATEDKTEPN